MLATSFLVAATTVSARWVMMVPMQRVRAALPWMQAATAGLLLGDGLLHMLPEAVDHGLSAGAAGGVMAVGVVLLVCVESVVRAWATSTDVAAFARMDVFGDVVHHVIDGVVIGAAFAVDATLGLVVAVTVMLHELPRGIGHAGVLTAGGFAPRRVFRLSLMAAAGVPLGAWLALALAQSTGLVGFGLAFAAGCTIYLACVDVLPAVWQRLGAHNRLAPALGMLGGVVFMWAAALVDHVH
ncbi:hypothetical protein LF63_0101320 [Oleiagrimonas soli]|uniref:Divalent cation transporter n=1 Tax=Oleiagrimonas soli TaxID=1543381 RepID=A0A099CYJ7_9GAMM|nr:hypothetical protein LF63_0101320 [Oleiagrimonas soli]